MRIPKPILRAGLAGMRRIFESDHVPLAVQRRTVDLISGASPMPDGTTHRATVIAGVPCEIVTPPGARPGSVMLYSHGGGYALGSARGYRSLAANLAQASGTTAVVPDYRLAPEHPGPAALDDIIGVYRALTEGEHARVGDDSHARHGGGAQARLANGLPRAEEVIIAGDSAGGGLTLALAQTIRDNDLDRPMAVVLICPWLDLSLDAAGARPAGRDPLITAELATKWCVPYIGQLASDDPRVSPLHGGLEDLPPIVMHSAGDDPLRHDALALGAAHRDIYPDSGQLTHRLFPRLWHDFHLQAGFVPEADNAIADLGSRLHALRAQIQERPK